MSFEETGNIFLESLLKEDFVKKIRSMIMSFGIIPSDHEIMIIGALTNGLLIHDSEGVSIFEDFLASFLGMNTNYVHTTRRSGQIILVNDFILLQDSSGCLWGVKGK